MDRIKAAEPCYRVHSKSGTARQEEWGGEESPLGPEHTAVLLPSSQYSAASTMDGRGHFQSKSC